MYSSLPSLVLGFHGCDRKVAEAIFAGETRLRGSENDYDWLGHGIYFWENNPSRALEYARAIKDNPRRGGGTSKIENETVVGAVIDLGHCLNLLDSEALRMLGENYRMLKAIQEAAGVPLPRNRPIGDEKDLLIRKLDCAVIESTHQYRKSQKMKPYDSVRGVFWEGKELYPNAGFKEKNHIQICVRNPNCVKGYFRPLEPIEGHPLP